jgi:6-pyruvoyltetrahydropterin/6-carboxytetrahydropterin synthase
MYELSKRFYFDSAHTLHREIDAESSRRIHGHSYRAEVTVRGKPDPESGMLVDLGLLERKLEEARLGLDHRFLDEINDLGPATLENLCAWIWRKLSDEVTNLSKVSVFRDSSGDGCTYFGEERLA